MIHRSKDNFVDDSEYDIKDEEFREDGQKSVVNEFDLKDIS